MYANITWLTVRAPHRPEIPEPAPSLSLHGAPIRGIQVFLTIKITVICQVRMYCGLNLKKRHTAHEDLERSLFAFVSVCVISKIWIPPNAAPWLMVPLHGRCRSSGIAFIFYMGCFTIRVHHLSHLWWKMKCFVIPQHAFFCFMNKPYIEYIKLLTYRHNLSWIQLK